VYINGMLAKSRCTVNDI